MQQYNETTEKMTNFHDVSEKKKKKNNKMA